MTTLLETLRGTAGFLALSALIFAPLELLRPVHARRPSWRSRAIDALLLAAGALLLRLSEPVLERAQDFFGSLPLAQLVNRQAAWLLGIEVFVLVELCGYALHRASHAWRPLWALHRVHHESESMDWLAAWRQHPLDALLQAAVTALPGLLLGFPLSQFVGLVLLRRLWTSFIHANVEVRLRWLAPLLATPAFHHGHHGSAPGELDTNFAGTLPVLDRLFGTLHSSDDFPRAYGLIQETGVEAARSSSLVRTAAVITVSSS